MALGVISCSHLKKIKPLSSFTVLKLHQKSTRNLHNKGQESGGFQHLPFVNFDVVICDAGDVFQPKEDLKMVGFVKIVSQVPLDYSGGQNNSNSSVFFIMATTVSLRS